MRQATWVHCPPPGRRRPRTAPDGVVRARFFLARRLAAWLFAALAVMASAPPATVRAMDVEYEVTAVLPHDPAAFTQGLLLHGGFLYESTGLNGRSSLRKTDPATGHVLAARQLGPEHFGEGLALWGGKFHQLTWKSGLVLVYDAATLAPLPPLPLEGEGWGAASTPFGILTSDGSSALVWRDPATFRPTRRLAVSHGGRPVARLNELEWVEGMILANVWHEDRIAVISPLTGEVKAWIDCAALRARLPGLPRESDLNGIAWDEAAKTLYVTGKLWPNIFALRLRKLPAP